ncbi:hypothetical protein IE81DRAFT_367487 [Ceraceosorus guamensis]|uniref:Uncharacterized protein n=1 Tax=Ceraceosorus guamensis TaxID=1522189 RepID=A0A316W181_9BASI|nr:hypothetical protein IE81DRAFT_367487 [Ceraceosorus guamensis]PWN41425.1 hypothetical protein IE81DRAFT_367487 [Ceraceosorus guamensis]
MSRQSDHSSSASTPAMPTSTQDDRRALMEPSKALQGLGQASPAEPRLTDQEREVLASVTRKIRRWRNIGVLGGGVFAGILVTRRKFSPIARLFGIGAGMGIGGVAVAPFAAIGSRDEINSLMSQDHFRETLKEAMKRGEDPFKLLNRSNDPAQAAGEGMDASSEAQFGYGATSGAPQGDNAFAPQARSSRSATPSSNDQPRTTAASLPPTFNTPSAFGSNDRASSASDHTLSSSSSSSSIPTSFDSSLSEPQSGLSGPPQQQQQQQHQSRWAELRNEKTSPESSWEKIRQESGRRDMPREVRGSTSSGSQPAQEPDPFAAHGAARDNHPRAGMTKLDGRGDAGAPGSVIAAGEDEGARQRERCRREFEMGMERERRGVQGSTINYN